MAPASLLQAGCSHELTNKGPTCQPGALQCSSKPSARRSTRPCPTGPPPRPATAPAPRRAPEQGLAARRAQGSPRRWGSRSQRPGCARSHTGTTSSPLCLRSCTRLFISPWRCRLRSHIYSLLYQTAGTQTHTQGTGRAGAACSRKLPSPGSWLRRRARTGSPGWGKEGTRRDGASCHQHDVCEQSGCTAAWAPSVLSGAAEPPVPRRSQLLTAGLLRRLPAASQCRS